ncbi:glycosyltransferase [Peribacillus alkalitolerans]|uniref:glycosyltransferase n=1 Tax=Peribacillus alkalitolerans TaxID=1550385 RepID=UPI0013CFE620|nr:glycosyltransferase [Peribacillus alkalitolerans]
MNKTLVLLTNRYPYFPGEEFLKAELEILSEEFQKVILIPTNQDVNYKNEQRAVPSNVEIIQMFETKTSKLSRVFQIFTSPSSIKWFAKELSTSLQFGIKGPLVMLNRLSLACEIKSILERKGYVDSQSVFYSYWLTPSALALAMLREKGLIRKAVSRVHGGDLYWERHKPAYIPFQNQVIKQLDHTYPISNNGKLYLSQKNVGVEDKLSVQRLGTFKNQQENEEVSFNKEGLKIVSCSYLKSVKRIHLLAEALKKCEFPIHWTHIGDGPEREKIEGIIKDVPSNVTVHFVGNKKNEEIHSIYSTEHFDLFVNVSESEGIPVTIMEACSYGIPVLATDVGGTSEIVDEMNGMLLPKEIEPIDITCKLADFYHLDASKKEVKRKSAFNKWDTMYNAEKNYTQFAKELKE